MRLSFKNESPYARVILVGIDQLIASSSNFLVIWICLVSMPTDAFGRFSYSWSTIALFIVLSRALFGIPALLDSEGNESMHSVEKNSSLTGTLVLGILAASITLGLYVLGGTSASEYWIFGLFLLAPMSLFQDQIRYLLIASRRTKFAIYLDLILLGFVSAIVISVQILEFIGWNLIFGLALGYALTISIFVNRNPIKLSIRNLKNFIKFDFHRRSRLVSDAVVAWGFGLIAITVIRAATGDSGIAAYNGLVFLFAPVSMLTVFVTLGLQAEVVRTKGFVSRRHKVGLVAITAVPMIWVLSIDSVPDAYLEFFLGESTETILKFAIPFSIAASLGIGLEVVTLYLKAHEKFSQLVRIRFYVGILSILLLSTTVLFNLDLSEIIWTLAIANLFGILLSVKVLRNQVNN
jgi:hypothetical protein